jgi:ADP-heptose:LPS heptosyltransferase
VPRLKWNPSHDDLAKKFDLPRKFIYIGVQAASETRYGLWRNWPLTRWREFFERLAHYPHVRVLLFGFEREPHFEGSHLVDLRGHTTLFELLSLLKNRCHALIAPDSGILAMTYYLDTPFALQIISLWADTNHGILKQNVASPNPLLIHRPLVGAHRDLSTLGVDCVLATLTGLTYEKTTQNET